MQAPGKPGPKILFELSQVETGRAVQDLRHGVQAKVGHGIRTLLCLRATRAKSQYKVGLTPVSSAEPQQSPATHVGRQCVQPTYEGRPNGTRRSIRECST